MILPNSCALILSLGILGWGFSGVSPSKLRNLTLQNWGCAAMGREAKQEETLHTTALFINSALDLAATDSDICSFHKTSKHSRKSPALTSDTKWQHSSALPDRSCTLKYYSAVWEPGKLSYPQGLPKRNLMINKILSHPLADGDSFFGQRFWVGNIMLHYGLEKFIFVFPIKWRLLKINHKWETYWVFLFMFF